MNSEFEVNGLFYDNQGELCRKYLDIKRCNSNTDTPDLMVVMMNPGSSKPEDGIDMNTVVSKAIPDPTQKQIMKVMNGCNSKYNYSRIINLSDLRESNSTEFYKKLENLQNIPHSIFSDERIDDFNTLFIKDVPVIFAWGVNKKLEPLAKIAIQCIGASNPYGILKKGTDWAYYHPLPRNLDDQRKWCNDIIAIIN